MQKKFSVIVPAFNEAKTVNHVLNTLNKNKNIDEIICIVDGSTDNTAEIAKSVKNVTTVILKKNRGKGYAMAKGVNIAKNDYVVFIDADLNTLTNEHLVKLINPILKNNYEAIMGFPMEFITDPLFINVGGQRIYPKAALIPLLSDMKKSRYGVEILLNNKLKTLKTKNVVLTKLGHVSKLQKRKGKELIKELIDWTKEVSKEVISQKKIGNSSDLIKKINEITNLKQAIEFTEKLAEIDVFETLHDYILKIQINLNTKLSEKNDKSKPKTHK